MRVLTYSPGLVCGQGVGYCLEGVQQLSARAPRGCAWGCRGHIIRGKWKTSHFEVGSQRTKIMSEKEESGGTLQVGLLGKAVQARWREVGHWELAPGLGD